MFSVKVPLTLGTLLPTLDNANQIQTLKASGNQPRITSLSPNVLAQAATPNLPRHVSEVRAQCVRANDSTSKVTVTFSRDPNDFLFIDSKIYVSGYKGNPAPVQVASGQSPVSFALENTGEPVNIIVQSSGNLGLASLSTAPNTTLQLAKTPLATVVTPAGNGTGSSGGVQTVRVPLSSAQILSSGSSPVTLLPAPGAGLINLVLAIMQVYTHNGTAYAGSTAQAIFYTGTPGGGFAFPNRMNVAFSFTTPVYCTTPASNAVLTPNLAVLFGTSTGANPTTGNGTMVFTVVYMIVPA